MNVATFTFSEDFIHFVWKYRLFDLKDLKTVSGEQLEIKNTGFHNSDSGPDFEQAQIRIGSTLWVGNVEIHISASDWQKHRHTQDEAYNSVVLHVVFRYNTRIIRADGTEIPTLELADRIPADIQLRYNGLMENMNWIPCEKQLKSVEAIYINTWLNRLLVERLEKRFIALKNIVDEANGSWDNVFYVMIAQSFGFKTNSLPFELLAKSLPQHILARHKDNAIQIEALVFGQAGFLNQQHKDEYPRKLTSEYRFLKKKYRLQSNDRFIWKFFRLRPQNFPTLRLAQFAALVIKSNHLFSKVIQITEIAVVCEMFKELPVNEYWQSHFRFDNKTKIRSAQMGREGIDNILRNTIAVALYSYGRYCGNKNYIARSLSILENLPAEENQITRGFEQAGLKITTANLSQALLHLKNNYCDQKKCLNCGIGIQLINKKNDPKHTNLF